MILMSVQISSIFISSMWSSNQTSGHKTDTDIMIFWVMVLFSLVMGTDLLPSSVLC
jgi:hypothetical protein